MKAIGRGVADKGRAIRVPVHAGEKMRKTIRTSNELSAELGREPTDEELTQRLKWKVGEVRKAKEAITEPTISLNESLGPGEDASKLEEFIEDERASETADEVMAEMEADESVFLIGEDVGAYGGAFKVTLGFQEEFGPWRVIDTPLSETAIVNPSRRLTWSMTCTSELPSPM